MSTCHKEGKDWASRDAQSWFNNLFTTVRKGAQIRDKMERTVMGSICFLQLCSDFHPFSSFFFFFLEHLSAKTCLHPRVRGNRVVYFALCGIQMHSEELSELFPSRVLEHGITVGNKKKKKKKKASASIVWWTAFTVSPFEYQVIFLFIYSIQIIQHAQKCSLSKLTTREYN